MRITKKALYAILTLLLIWTATACTVVTTPDPSDTIPKETVRIPSEGTTSSDSPTIETPEDSHAPQTEPEPEQTDSPETEPTTEPDRNPITEPDIEPITKPVTEPDTETEPSTEPVTTPGTEPVTQPVVEPDTEPVVEPDTEPVVEPDTESDTETATAPATTEPIVEPETEPPHTHEWGGWDMFLPPTCVDTGIQERLCTCGASEQEILPIGEHTLSDGICVICGYSRPDFTDPDIYASDYGYRYLGTLPNGAAMQTYYTRLDTAAKEFHISESAKAAGTTDRTLSSETPYGDLGITYDEANLAWYCLRRDRPLYYWIANTWTYSIDSGWIRVHVDEEYAEGAARAAVNRLIYTSAETYYDALAGEESEYLTALGYHDQILSVVDYAYESDGVTPSEQKWAHSIVGVFTRQGVVCDGYAKAFQLLLNVSGIENVYVRGTAGTINHAWNLVRLDDGEWYWFDITWDDQKTAFRGIMYNYFAVNDTQVTDWYDAHHGYQTPSVGSSGFLQKHTHEIKYTLPERADGVFSDDRILELRETFTVDGLTYALVGFNKVQLISIGQIGAVQIPAEVVFDGRAYEVVSIGAMDENGYFLEGTVTPRNQVTSLTVAGSVHTIDMGAFLQCTDLNTVILREGVGVINHFAFWNCPSLTEIHIPKSTSVIGLQAFAYCFDLRNIYYDGTIAEWESIAKGDLWNQECPVLTVHCLDGDVTVQPA